SATSALLLRSGGPSAPDPPPLRVPFVRVLFTKHPSNQTVSQGNAVRLGCAFQGVPEPDIVWMKDGERLYSTDQMFITLGEQHWETFHSVKSVQQHDAGQYWCEVEYHGLTVSSERAWITVEGVPHFIQEPRDVATFPNVPFNLTCGAVGPPEPVEVLWWLGGVQQGESRPSPSVLQVQGVNSSLKFYCEAKNSRGISVSRTGTVHIKGELLILSCAVGAEICVTLSWKPGFTGHSELSTCIIQVIHTPTPTREFLVPPYLHILSGLRSHSNYSVRVSCANEVGASPFSPWLHFQTPESAPRNLTFDLSEQQLSLNWAELQEDELQGKLLAYKVTMKCDLSQFHLLVRKVPASATHTHIHLRSHDSQIHPDWLCRPPVDSLGISNDLKNKLQDVLIPERQLTLGHMLGKGEFGSVREAFLRMEDSLVQKVAVKVLKSDITSSGDIEQCLKEAAYMKDFHHPNVIQLIGVSLHRRPGQRLPIPMVVLPFMKHGDLHTFLLLSRLGEQPFDLSLQTLIQFMLDIARGMDYLSSRSIIHRDLAARNCMLDENMTVCVADFGLSKKIYSGDYYRQGSVSKLPVKWIALESLADNVYTAQSDVWAFGVTMWEVMTRGQTPYPGVENSEIYEFLIKGERLKKPPDCRDDIYEIMHSCWSPVPKCRPSFQHLVAQLEALQLNLSPAPPPTEPLHYVNLEGEQGDAGREGGGAARAPGPEEAAVASRWSVPWQQRAEDEEKDWLMVGSGAALAIGGDYRYIFGPRGGPEEVEGGGNRRESMGTLQEVGDEEEDVIINV
uniref:Tyrosine-protein kinase receptor TYRO3 n=1 Tax=Mastacembelus armatus TaxID=205130 RepID=A0A3Q3L4E5_9TELE